ncbi:MAG: MFS transporter [Acidobacteria bacterium]|nr:MFS transporter [Acidobacteriota bacterium]
MAATPNSGISSLTDITNARRWGIIALLFVASMINYMDRATLSYALPPLSDDLRLDPMQKGYLVSAFFWSYAYMQIPIGWVADRFHLKWVYAGLFAVWSLACGFVGLANTLSVLIGLRILLGLGESIYLPGGMKVVSQMFPPDRRGLPSGLFDFGTRIGLVLGGVIIPALTILYGWRAMFMVVGFAALLWLIPWLLTYPGRALDTNRGDLIQKPSDRKESFVVLFYPFLLLLSPLWFLLNALLANPLPRSSESPTWGPILRFFELLRNRNLFGIILGFFCFDYFWYVLLTWLPDYLVKGRGMPIEKAGHLTAITFFIFGVTEPIGGWIADRLIRRGWSETRTRKGIVTIGWVTGLLMIPAGFVKSDATALFCIFGAAFVGLSTGNLLAILQCCAPPDKVGTWTGVKNYSGNLGGIAAPLLMGYLLKHTDSYGYGFAVGAILLLLGLIPYWLIVQELEPPRVVMNGE